MKFYLAVFCSAILLTLSCAFSSQPKKIIKEGISGRVTLKEGNQMPGPGKKESHKGKGVQRTIFIYALTTTAQTEGESPLFREIHQRLIRKFKTDANGFFKCKLPAGKYSVFTGEKDHQFFAGISNGAGELNPVEVLPGKLTSFDIEINYNAVY